MFESNITQTAHPQPISAHSAGQVQVQACEQGAHNFNWIRNLKCINTLNHMDEFVLLFSALNDVSIKEAHDVAKWRWTANGCYCQMEMQLPGDCLAYNPQGPKPIFPLQLCNGNK